MNYTVEFNKHQKIVMAIAEGAWDSTTDNAMVYKMLEMIHVTGSSKVLLDIRELHYNLPMFQIFERAKEMREQRRQFRVHVGCPRGQPRLPDPGLGSLHAQQVRQRQHPAPVVPAAELQH